MGLFDDRPVLVTQPEVDSQALGGAPVVLEKQRVLPVMNLPPRIAGLYRCLKRGTGEEIFQLRRVEWWPRGISGIWSVASQKCNAASGIAKRSAAEGLAVQIPAKLEGVFAPYIGDVIYKLGDRIRPLELGPLESAEAGEKISAEA